MQVTEKFILDRYVKVGRDYFMRRLPKVDLPDVTIEKDILYDGNDIKNAYTKIGAIIKGDSARLGGMSITFHLGSIEKSLLRFFETQYKEDFEVIATLYVDYLIAHELSHVCSAHYISGEDGSGVMKYFERLKNPKSAAKEEAMVDDMAYAYLKSKKKGKAYSEYLSLLKRMMDINNRAIMNGYTSRDELDFHRLIRDSKTYKAVPGHTEAVKRMVVEFEDRKSQLIKIKDGLYMDSTNKIVLEPRRPF